MISMTIVSVIALAAAVGLGYQIGFRRGTMHAAQHAEENALVTAVIQIGSDKSQPRESLRRRTRGIYSLRKRSLLPPRK